MKEFLVSEFTKKYPKIKIFMISSATWEWVEELKNYLIDNYANNKVDVANIEDNENDIKIYNLKNKIDPKKVTVTYEWDLLFKAKWERL